MRGSNPGLLRLRHWQSNFKTTLLDLNHNRLDLIHTRLYLIQPRLGLIHTRLDLIHNADRSRPQANNTLFTLSAANCMWSSVPNPWHFGTDSDPWIRTLDYRSGSLSTPALTLLASFSLLLCAFKMADTYLLCEISIGSFRPIRQVFDANHRLAHPGSSYLQCCGSMTFGVDPDPDPRIHASGYGSGSGSCYFRHWPSSKKLIF
jgi:hypothetical protein